MSGVLLGLLAVAWGVLLLPKLFRGSEDGFNVFGLFRAFFGLFSSRRSNGSSNSSMGSLARSAANGIRPISGRSSGGYSGFGLPGSGSGSSGSSRAMSGLSSRSSYDAAGGRRANKRRRDVFMGLLFSSIGTAVLALVPGFSMLWKANFVVDALLLGYVGLLVSARRPASARAPMRAGSQSGYRYDPSDYQLDYDRSDA